MTAPLLADALGPRARRRAAVISVVAAAVVAAIVLVALRRFGDRGQLEWDRWSYFVKPEVLRFLWGGLYNTLRLAGAAMAAAVAAGFVLALLRLARNVLVRWAAAAWIEVFRGLPLVLQMFFAYLGLPKLGVDLSPFQAALVGLGFYNSAILAEIFRAGILSLERGQREAALGIGLTDGQAMRLVILPQAVRRMIPALVSQLVTLLKDTSLALIVAYDELLRRFQLAAKGVTPSAELQGFILGACVYIMICFSLSRLARRLEQRQRSRYQAGTIAVTGVEELTAVDRAGPAGSATV